MTFELQHSDIPQPTYEPATSIGPVVERPAYHVTVMHYNVPLFPMEREPIAFDPERADDWMMPAVKPWAPASAIDHMCDQAMASIGESIEQAADKAWLQHCQKFRITHRMHVAADGKKTVLLCGDPWPSSVSEESFNWHAESDAIWYFEPKEGP